MATENRRQSNHLSEKILSEPWRFDFFQLIRIMELEAGLHDSTVGDFTQASKEAIKFRTNPHLAFEPAPVKKVSKDSDNDPWRVLVNFWGLNGSMGVMPFHYSELILQQQRKNDYSLRDFIDLFNHRSVSLFYRAWRKHRPWIDVKEKGTSASKYKKNWHEEQLKSFTGLSNEKQAAFNKPQGAWLNYSGLGAARVTNPTMLAHAINHHFGINVRINEFKAQWELMPIDVQTKLGDRRSNGTNVELGSNAILGQRCWNAQNRFEIEVKEIDYALFMTFAPGSQKLQALYELIKLKVGTEMDFDLTLKIKEKHLEAAQLSSDQSPQLGWNTRLQSRKLSDRLIKVSVSKHGMLRVA